MKELIDTTFTTVEQNGEQTRLPDLGGFETDDDVRYSVMDRGDGTCVVRVGAPQTTIGNIVATEAATVLDDAETQTALDAHRPSATLENLDVPDPEVDAMLDDFATTDVLEPDEVLMVRVVQNWSGLDRTEQRRLLTEYDVGDPRALVHSVGESTLQEIVDEYAIGGLPDLPTSTLARSVVQLPTVGGQVLQDQELTAIDKVARAKGLDRASEVTKNTWVDNSGELGGTARRVLEGRKAEHEAMVDYLRGNALPPWTSDSNPPAKGAPTNGVGPQ